METNEHDLTFLPLELRNIICPFAVLVKDIPFTKHALEMEG